MAEQWDKWFEEKKKQGICITCGKEPATAAFSRCLPCREKRRTQRSGWKHQTRTNCVDCGIRAHGYRCKDCWRLFRSKYPKRDRNSFWEKIFEIYGKECACCGETTPKFLTIDHINNDGRNFRGKDLSYYCVGKRSDIRILCYNCNCGRARNGGKCPHE